jgi:hypothetical protein
MPTKKKTAKTAPPLADAEVITEAPLAEPEPQSSGNGYHANGLGSLSQFLVGTEDLTILAGRKEQLNIPVGKPDPQIWFRVHPTLTVTALVFTSKDPEDRHPYLVDKAVAHKITTGLAPTYLFLVIDKSGTLRLWPCRVPGFDGRTPNSWHLTALEAAQTAMSGWIRVESDQSAGGNVITHPLSDLGAVRWPERDLADTIRVAFAGRIIDREDHPVILRLEGRL